MKKLLVAVLALIMLFSFANAEEVVSIEGGGWNIPATICMPEGEGPFPLVVMYHGTGSNREEAGNGYKMLAPLLAEKGIASVRFDFVGNGDSTASYRHYTLTSGVRDGRRVIDYMLEKPEIDPDKIGVIGWSQGGTVAMLTAAWYDDIKALVTWAGATDLMHNFGSMYEEAEQNGFAKMEFDWREPLELSLAWFDEARDIDVAHELSNYTGAIFVLAGENDTVVPLETMEEITSNTGSKYIASEIIKDADHTFNVFSDPELKAYKELAEKTVNFFEEMFGLIE
ncbi:MAG: alpha/beta fold hydrolase [Christensenellaceae bacterium]|nr:alpha/beta fold hydrolase [Christensenellaceae bacterium]